MDVKIEESWKKRLADEFEKDYFKQLTDFVKQEYRQGTVYPPGPYMFNESNCRLLEPDALNHLVFL